MFADDCTMFSTTRDSSDTEAVRVHVQQELDNIQAWADKLQVSKATTLQKTAAYITKLQQEQTQAQEEAQRIREDVEKINTAI
eukprot:g43859.t1